MAAFHQPDKGIGPAKPRRRGKIACQLISPAAVKGILGRGHELNVGEMMSCRPRYQPVGQRVKPIVAAVPVTPPAARMQFVDVEGKVGPGSGAQGMGRAGKELQPGGGHGGGLVFCGKGIGAQPPDAVGTQNVVLVQLAPARPGRLAPPETVLAEGKLGGGIEVPAVPVPQHLNPAGMRGKHTEQPAVVLAGWPRAEQLRGIGADTLVIICDIRPHPLNLPLPILLVS